MAFDGLITKSIANELNKYAVGCKVNKIYEPTRQDLILNLYGNGHNFDLLICTNANFSRIHITNHTKPNPITAPNFCMFLRKHLTGAKILAVNSYDLERIISITFEAYNELNDKIIKKLYIEIMGQFSNIILVNENNTILDCLNHVVTKTRELLPVRPYIFPTNFKHSFINLSSFDEFYEICTQESSEPIDKKLSDSFIGLSRSFIQNICNLNNIDLSNYSKSDLELLYSKINNILDNINDLHVNCFDSQNGKDYFLNINTEGNTQLISDYLDEFYYQKEQKALFAKYREQLLSYLLNTLNKYKKRLININEKLQDCDDMEKYKLYGELLTSNLYRLKGQEDSIEVLNYYTNTNVIIPLDSAISPSKNVEKYYKKYNKCQNTLTIVNKQKLQTEEELKYIESLIYSIQDCKTLSDLEEISSEICENFNLNLPNSSSPQKTKEQKSMPKQYTINGFTVYVGKNNKQNDLLTKSANKEDMWFHTQQIHGSHVILKTNGKKVDYDTILKCASLAATNSKAKNSNNVPVDYTFVKYVRKPSGSKPGMAIYTHYKTVFVN